MRLEFRPAALSDLEDIREYIALDRPRTAQRIYARLIDACSGLIALPARGREGLSPGTRELVTVRPFVIVYAHRDDAVTVLRIIHGARRR